jgi:Ca2+/Na+ antiporter
MRKTTTMMVMTLMMIMMVTTMTLLLMMMTLLLLLLMMTLLLLLMMMIDDDDDENYDDNDNDADGFQSEVGLLRGEVAQLKTLLLAHQDCPITLQQKSQGQLALHTSQFYLFVCLFVCFGLV